jgi:hypothetical protein
VQDANAQSPSPHIVGGRAAEPGAWPWQVALVYRTEREAYNGFFCGGSLIASDWVLTAAHCLDGTDATLIDVLIGAHRLTANAPRIQADRALIHPDYGEFTLDGDLGLLHLSQPVTNTALSLFGPAHGAELAYLRGTVTGWGNMDPSSWLGEFPDVLQEVSLPLIGADPCGATWGQALGDKHICAGYPNMTKAVCSGDSGGPLMVQTPGGEWLQVGIVSAGPIGCTDSTLPDIFTRVGAYRQWIDGCMQNPESALCTGADVFEPDNTPVEAAVYNTFGVTQTHTFHRAGDQDWLQFDVSEGHFYQIQTQHVVTYTAPVDTVVWLFGDMGRTPLAYNDDGSSRPPFPLFGTVINDSRLNWRALRDGRLYLSVENLAATTGVYPPFGPTVKYAIVVREYAHQAYLPAIEHNTGKQPLDAGAAP